MVHACACVCAYVYVNSARCEADWRPDCHEFALPVHHHSNVEIGHGIFSTVIPIPTYSKNSCCRYWQNRTLGHFIDLTIKQFVYGSI